MAPPLLRHQSSLQGFLDFSSTSVLTPDQFNQATAIFDQIVSRYEPSQAERPSPTYKHITLLRTVHESVISKDIFLNHFFLFVDADLQRDPDASTPTFSDILTRFDNLHSWSLEQLNEFQGTLVNFSDYLVNNFFLPLKTSGHKTPQPTPTLSLPQTSDNVVGTRNRVARLRQKCLTRDRYRCVISRKFDTIEARARWNRDRDDAKDDDGALLKGQMPEYLEVAHILPHSLTSASSDRGNQQLSESKKIALQILRMFDPDAPNLIEGPDIDRPTNAITLTHKWHYDMGAFKVSFQPTIDQSPHSYVIDYINTSEPFRDPLLPINRQLYITPTKTIDPPSPRLLAIHHAIARILHLSGAGDYIDHIIRDMEEMTIKENGSTSLGHYIRLKIDGWLDGISVC
ncbi:uncharacterized protein PV06_08276 [Exophiala oligosperma]|uniref:HNH nuclease domain-containing protein n=1 Tax=Exophiala oligosperma TaxID=215243 RepID=A0A0D2AHR8_9EURO|nr:uncharacterized protein PV06_08276 [Exophiala oligosperma]KIW39686.1 hypothetical protein PV06_08276 [Exophiala oligosperma]